MSSPARCFLFLIAILIPACGESGGDSSGGVGGNAGANSAELLFPNAPSCASGQIRVIGTIAGESYTGGSSPSNWSGASITFGVGETSGSMFGNEVELRFERLLKVGEKVAITQGTLYVHEPHSLATQYLCIRSGEIALVKAPPTDEVLIQFTIGSAVHGRTCDGAPVDIALDGCIARTSKYVP